ncbi:MAG: lysyl oxidase family protein [Gaiellales bacterium]
MKVSGKIAVCVLVATSLVAAASALARPAAPSASARLLPDLDPVAPGSIQAIAADDGSGRIFLTFTFAFDNVGAGPLRLSAHRASTNQSVMVADQVVSTSGGGTVTIPRIGKVAWLPDRGFTRWGFKHQSYRLVPAGPGPTRVAETLPLCLEDNRRTPKSSLAGEPKDKVFKGRCGKRQDTLLKLELGLSVGWRNLHLAKRLGQLIDITKARSGEYTLQTQVNAAGKLAERSTANNAASARISITWKQGSRLPTIKLLKTCDDSARCS